MKKTFMPFLLISTLSYGGNEKPFIKKHIEHTHINFVNAVVYQGIQNYSTIYETAHLFFQLNLDPNNLIFINSSISFGNGLNKKLERLEFSTSSTAEDLEDDLKDINGTNRKYLLEVYYQFTTEKLSLAFGLLDSTSFIDSNEFANDELLQFLNPTLVNNPIAVLPSYNPGINLNLKVIDNLSVDVLYMENKPDKDNVGIVEFDYSIGNFNIRPYYYYVFGTEENKGIGLSSDFEYKNLGFFLRLGRNNLDFKNFYSFGSVINLEKFGEVGLGYSFLYNRAEGNNLKVAEVYHKYSINKYISFTTDIQYLKEVRERLVYGFRFYFEY